MSNDPKQVNFESSMIVIQANIDDMNSELYPYIMDQLFSAGAKDVYLIPIIMKKGRPGIILNVLTEESLQEKMETLIFKETTTFGLRYQRVLCQRLRRTFTDVQTQWGTVRVKTSFFKDLPAHSAPEYEDCIRLAKEHQIPAKEIFKYVQNKFDPR